MQRPTGITFLAIVAFIVGGLHFIGSFLAFASGSWLSAQAKSGYFLPAVSPAVNAFGNLGFWIGLLGMITALVTLAAAAGLWVLSKFGYWLTIVALVLNLVIDAIDWFGGYASAATLLGAAVAVVALIYMSRPQVRHAFDGFPIDAPTQVTT
jgi:hypothetical protein